ncbi:hypothetical protein P0F65_15940 [Sphingomonas sp. I4]
MAAEPDVALPPMPLSEQVSADYRATRLSLKGHPMAFLRRELAAEGVLSAADLHRLADGRRAKVAGWCWSASGRARAMRSSSRSRTRRASSTR